MNFQDSKIYFNNVCGIYEIYNFSNGKRYIGQSINIGKRLWNDHRIQLVNCFHINKDLENDFHKYGEDKFQCRVLKVVNDTKLLQSEELKFRNHYQPDFLYNKVGFNRNINLKDSDIARFWKYVDKTDNCWNWIGSGYKYGNLRIGKDIFPSHRISYYIHNGEFDLSLSVCHTCDNPKCVNPNHLFLGSHDDNMKDRISKSRGNCKINREIAQEIRNLHHIGLTDKEILLYVNNKYDIKISHTTITNVVQNKIWNFDGKPIIKRHAQLTKEIVAWIRERGQQFEHAETIKTLTNEKFNIKTSAKSVCQIIWNEIWIDENYIVPTHRKKNAVFSKLESI